MRRLLAVLIGAVLLLGATPALASKTHEGSFTYVKYGPAFKHRVFLQVKSSNKGDKSCNVKLNGRIQAVDLGTNAESEVFNMFYLYVHGAEKAYAQALAAPSPTPRIQCGH